VHQLTTSFVITGGILFGILSTHWKPHQLHFEIVHSLDGTNFPWRIDEGTQITWCIRWRTSHWICCSCLNQNRVDYELYLNKVSDHNRNIYYQYLVFIRTCSGLVGPSSGELQQGVLEREMRANFHIKANDSLGFVAFDMSYYITSCP